jgi:hypothetical protein
MKFADCGPDSFANIEEIDLDTLVEKLESLLLMERVSKKGLLPASRSPLGDVGDCDPCHSFVT